MATYVKATWADGSGARSGITIRIDTSGGITERVTGSDGYATFDCYNSSDTGTIYAEGRRVYSGTLGGTIEARLS